MNMDAQAFKDSLVEVFNYPIYAKSKIEDDDKVFARFPWLKAIDDHPRYSVSFGYDKDDLIVGYKYMTGFSIKAENWSRGNLIGDYATFNLPFEDFNTQGAYTRDELLGGGGFLKIYKSYGGSSYREDYILPIEYDEIGIILRPDYASANTYKSVTRPDGLKFDKKGSSVIVGYTFQRILRNKFNGESNLHFTDKDWQRTDSIRNKHIARFFYELNTKYFTEHGIEQNLIEDIIANAHLIEGEKDLNWKNVLKDYNERKQVDSLFNTKKNKYTLAGLYGLDEANNIFIHSDVFDCIKGNCDFGEGTVDMGKTTFTGIFKNGFGISGILSEKSSGKKLKINQSLATRSLNDGEYLTEEDQKVSFYRKYDTIYFNVDTPKFTYVGTTKAFTADGGLLDGQLTQKKEDVLEIFTYRNGELDTQTATLRAKGAGEYEYTGPYKVVDGNMVPFGKGIIKYPMYSSMSAEIEVTGNLFDAMLQSPKSKGLLNTIFRHNDYIGSKVLGKWHKQYLEQKDAERYKLIQTLSNEDLLKFAYKENEYYYDNNKAATGAFSEFILGKGLSPNGNLEITLINKEDVKASVCISIIQAKDNGGNKKDPKTGQWVRDIDPFAEADKGCFYFQKRGDVRTLTLKADTKVPYTFRISCEDCSKGDYYVIFVDN